jgi:hypothetical protein
MRRAAMLTAALGLLLAGCGKKQPEGPPAATAEQALRGKIVPSADSGQPQPLGDASNPMAFAPLRSLQVKEAIYQAMKTGETQRWQDGSLSGYAVPSAAKGVYGCRAVRYTVDQLPDAEPQTINACQ